MLKEKIQKADHRRLKAWASPAGLAQLDSGRESCCTDRECPICAGRGSRPRYSVPRHVVLLNERLLELAAGSIRRLLVCMPPRHGKSILCSKYLPAWYLGRYPDRSVIQTSYSAELAHEWSQHSRDVLTEWGPAVFHVAVDRNVRSRARWALADHPGREYSAGAGGALTGRGANLLVVDDPIKGYEQALSETYRRSIWHWWLSTAKSRIEPGGSCLLIQTRWHEDDLAGMILRSEADEWETIVLPALATDCDSLGRRPGDALWPERFDRETLEKLSESYDHDEARLGPYWWSALYQQEPRPQEGAILKRQWFRYFERHNGGEVEEYRLENGGGTWPADRCWRLQTVDLAVSEKQSADYTVVSTWAVTPRNELLLLDVFRDRIGFPAQVDAIKRLVGRWKPGYVLVEQVAYQLAMVQELRSHGIPVLGRPATGDKVARSQTFAARCEGGSVYFRRDLPALSDVEAELLSFPTSRHDDVVDTCSMAASEITKHAAMVA